MNEHEPPTPSVLKGEAADIIERIYAGGLAKHGEHVWYRRETVRHHTDRATRHIATANMRRDGNETCETDGEDTIDHLERALIRTLFAIVKVREGHR
jgi:hypothetical protein